MDYGVITITLNAAATVRRTVESVLCQGPPPPQYVFVDGGSTDGTLPLLADLMAEAARRVPSLECRLLAQAPGRGIANAWNLGLGELRTDLVFLLNADDWYEPDAASAVLAAFAAHPGAEVLMTPVRFWCTPDDPQPRTRCPKPLQWLPVLMPVLHPGCFVKRAVYARVGAFDERYVISADYDFIYRCRRAGVVFQRHPAPLVNMLMGGLARQRLAVARRETLEVGLAHACWRGGPRLAYALRRLLGR